MRGNTRYGKVFWGTIAVISFFFIFFAIAVSTSDESLLFGKPMNYYTVNFLSVGILCLVICLFVIILSTRINRLNEKDLTAAVWEQYLANSVHSGFVNFVLNAGCRIAFASNGFYDIIGYGKEEVSQKFNNCIVPLIFPEDYEGLKGMYGNLKDGDSIQREVRMTARNGKTVWVLLNGNFMIGKNGDRLVSLLLIDITESKRIHEKLLLEEERYRVAAEISNDILFEYDIKEDVMKFADKFKDLYGRNPFIPEFTERDFTKECAVHPEDMGIFSEYCCALKSGREMIEAEFRICDCRNEYIWCQTRGKTVYDDNRVPLKVIGKLANINLHKKELERLEYKAKRDPLTGVYNKTVMKELVDAFIQKHRDGEHVFMIIDIDDFKKINDRYGHLQGDRILSHVIGQVKMIFTSGEIIGRIGGDEFAIFAGDVGNMDTVILKARLLQRALSTEYEEGDCTVAVSGSIGVSAYPKDGKSYNQLLNSADKALYEVKENGKNGYKILT